MPPPVVEETVEEDAAELKFPKGKSALRQRKDMLITPFRLKESFLTH